MGCYIWCTVPCLDIHTLPPTSWHAWWLWGPRRSKWLSHLRPVRLAQFKDAIDGSPGRCPFTGCCLVILRSASSTRLLHWKGGTCGTLGRQHDQHGIHGTCRKWRKWCFHRAEDFHEHLPIEKGRGVTVASTGATRCMSRSLFAAFLFGSPDKLVPGNPWNPWNLDNLDVKEKSNV